MRTEQIYNKGMGTLWPNKKEDTAYLYVARQINNVRWRTPEGKIF